MDIVLKEAEVREYVIDGLKRTGLAVGSHADNLLFKFDKNSDSFVVEVKDVQIVPVAPVVTELPKLTSPKKLFPTNEIKEMKVEEDADGDSMFSILAESRKLQAESAKTGPKQIDPRADAAAFGSRVFKTFDEIGLDPNVITEKELNAGVNPQAGT